MKAGTDFIGIGAGALIFNDTGEVLLMKRGKGAKNEVGHFTIPGGSIEFGETLIDGVAREVREEIGCEIEIDGKLPAIDHIIESEKQHWVTTIFTCRIKSGEPTILENEKCDEMGWFALSNLPSPLSASVKETLENFYQLSQKYGNTELPKL